MASGFNNTPPASEYRRYTSWGRTRQPKNVTGTQNGSITVNVEYNTENQRYLLVHSTAVVLAGDLQVWSHAIQNWAILNTSDLAAGTLHVLELGGSDRVRCDNLNSGVVKLATSTF